MLKIFIINGPARSGKTTFGEMVGEFLGDRSIPFEHNSSVAPVKEYLRNSGWEGNEWDGVTKDDYWRRAMYECKCWMIEGDKHVFDKYAFERISSISESSSSGVLFFDIREPENIEQMKKFFEEEHPEIEVLAVFVDRDEGEEFANYADSSQRNYEYDVYVDNNGDLEGLRRASRSFIDEYILVGGEINNEIGKK